MIKIGKTVIGGNHPVYIIAEACDNHMGSLENAKEMCRQAKLAGCDCIKFQHHLPDEEMLRNVPMSANFNMPLYDFLKMYALTIDQHIAIKQYCEEIGIQYLCTPFSLKAAYELNEIGVEAFKIGSGEMTDIPTLIKIAEMGKPMIVSTGMSTMDEIERTYKALLNTGIDLALTDCVSEYPPRYEDINLNVIGKMKNRFPDAVIGHSDHTPDLYTCYAAVALGACIIEKHVILDKLTPGPDQSVSIDFFDLSQLVNGIRKIEKALGTEKRVQKKEEDIREWAFRSIVTTCEIKAGMIIKSDMLWSKRPGTGIPSWRMNEYIGRVAKRDIQRNVLLEEDDLI